MCVLVLEMTKRGHCVASCGHSQDKFASILSHLKDSSSSSSSSPSNSPHLLFNVDVESNGSVEELANGLVEKKRIPDIVVNNAGTINKTPPIWDVPAEEFDNVIDINVKEVANMLHHFIHLMID